MDNDEVDELTAHIEEWVRFNYELPTGWWVARNAYLRRNIHWRHPVFGIQFTVLIVDVMSDGEIQLLHDDRQKIAGYLANTPEGFEREKRLFQALQQKMPSTPRWVLDAYHSDPFMDRRGIDGWVQVAIGEEKIKLPFQVKSGKGEAHKFFEKYPEYRDVVGMVYISDDIDDEQLRQRVWSVIGLRRGEIVKGLYSVEDFKKKITHVLRASHV